MQCVPLTRRRRASQPKATSRTQCASRSEGTHHSKKPHLSGGQMWLFCWQRMRDSNPRERSQSPVCYRYTNPLCVKHGYYYTETTEKVKNFFPFSYENFTVSILPNTMAFIPVPRGRVCPSVHCSGYRQRSALRPDPSASSEGIPAPAGFARSSVIFPGFFQNMQGQSHLCN